MITRGWVWWPLTRHRAALREAWPREQHTSVDAGKFGAKTGAGYTLDGAGDDATARLAAMLAYRNRAYARQNQLIRELAAPADDEVP